jgi:20S proteasome alpha/beta subunit
MIQLLPRTNLALSPPTRRKKMTLCVAAACHDRGKPRIVIASDWRIETTLSSGEIQEKLYWITDSWPVLIAGTVSRAIELKDTYRQHFGVLLAAKAVITPDNVIDVVKAPLLAFKHKLANEYIAARLGMTYEYFLQNGKAQLPSDTFDTLTADIVRIDFGCNLLICTFLENEPFIFLVDSQGGVQSREHFAAIGSGSDIAESVFFQRDHEARLSVGQGVYHAFEAMRLGAKAPGVGSEHAISVLSKPDKNRKVEMEEITDRGRKFLDKCFRKYGPKEFYRFPSFPKGTFSKR